MPFLIAATLVMAGWMQFMPWTKFGLRECRSPLVCGVSLPSKQRMAGMASGHSFRHLLCELLLRPDAGSARVGNDEPGCDRPGGGGGRDGETDAKAAN